MRLSSEDGCRQLPIRGYPNNSSVPAALGNELDIRRQSGEVATVPCVHRARKADLFLGVGPGFESEPTRS